MASMIFSNPQEPQAYRRSVSTCHSLPQASSRYSWERLGTGQRAPLCYRHAGDDQLPTGRGAKSTSVPELLSWDTKAVIGGEWAESLAKHLHPCKDWQFWG